MHIKVLGTGCPDSHATVALIHAALKRHNLDIPLYHVHDIHQISLYAVANTPAVVIDGMVVHAGGVPTAERVEQWLSRVTQPA